jgi:hypothetical protein
MGKDEIIGEVGNLRSLTRYNNSSADRPFQGPIDAPSGSIPKSRNPCAKAISGNEIPSLIQGGDPACLVSPFPEIA